VPEDSLAFDSGVLARNVVEQDFPEHFFNYSHNLIPGATVPLSANIGFPDWILSVFCLGFYGFGLGPLLSY